MFMAMNYLLFTEIVHLAVVLLVVAWFWQRFPRVNKLHSMLVGLLFGFFVDGDHMVEYLIYLGNSGRDFSVEGFFSSDYFSGNGMIMVLGHAWEWVVILLCVYWFNENRKAVWPKYALLAGVVLAGHLVTDQITNMTSPLFYFILYRIVNGFGLDI